MAHHLIHAVIGDIEVTVPADILNYEIERVPGETDKKFEAARAAYDKLFRAALAANNLGD